jgi:hypothetical protein
MILFVFITSFDRPSFGKSADKVVVTTQETTQEKIKDISLWHSPNKPLQGHVLVDQCLSC